MKRGFVSKMAVAVNNHAELRTPVADVIIAGNLVANKSYSATDGVTNDRASKVPHVHWLRHVRR